MFALCRVAAVAAAFVLAPAFAAGVSSQAQALLEQNRAGEALQLLEDHLKQNPQDAEARFTRGLTLVRMDRNKDAIRVFADLTRDYPQLPEPYNNLAVLYAAQGDYEKARDALEAALATHPSYATAHENLGDIYAALAGAAYNRALMLDESNQMVRRKLALINQLDGGAAGATATAAAPVVGSEPPAAVQAPAPEPATTLAAPEPQPAAKPGIDADTRAALRRALDAWAAAWSEQDLEAYFAAYAEDFVPEGGLARSSWETQRRDRISEPRSIRVRVVEPSFTANGPAGATATFRQEYTSDSFSDVVTKVLDMKLTAGGWKIAREYSR